MLKNIKWRAWYKCFTGWNSHSLITENLNPPLGPGEPKTEDPKGAYAKPSSNTAKSHKQSIKHVVIAQGYTHAYWQFVYTYRHAHLLSILQFERECNEKLFMETSSSHYAAFLLNLQGT